MKTFTRIVWSIALTAMLLAGVLAMAQQDKAKNAKIASGSSQTGAQSPAASANKSGTILPSVAKAKSSVTLDAASKDAAKMQSGTVGKIKSDPLNEEGGNGVNPLYEKPESSLKTPEATTPAPERAVTNAKDGYRPGNNKSAKKSSTANGNHKDIVEYKDGEDETMHTRPASQK